MINYQFLVFTFFISIVYSYSCLSFNLPDYLLSCHFDFIYNDIPFSHYVSHVILKQVFSIYCIEDKKLPCVLELYLKQKFSKNGRNFIFFFHFHSHFYLHFLVISIFIFIIIR
jgi:hypothetical protein